MLNMTELALKDVQPGISPVKLKWEKRTTHGLLWKLAHLFSDNDHRDYSRQLFTGSRVLAKSADLVANNEGKEEGSLRNLALLGSPWNMVHKHKAWMGSLWRSLVVGSLARYKYPAAKVVKSLFT